MTDEERELCNKAIEILFDCDYDNPHRAKRVQYAQLIETQTLVGNVTYNKFAIELSRVIIEASEKEKQNDNA